MRFIRSKREVTTQTEAVPQMSYRQRNVAKLHARIKTPKQINVC